MESLHGGGPLKVVELTANATTVATSFAGLFGPASLGRDVIAFKANEIKFSLSLTELMTEANKPNPDAVVIGQALLGVVSSSAGIVGAIPGIPMNIKLSANLIALGADAGQVGIGKLPQLLSDLESNIKSSQEGDWNFDSMGTGSEAILYSVEDVKSTANAVSDLGEITITAGKIIAGKITTPADSATRTSNNYISDTSANDHLVEIKTGGTLWDAYVLQKNTNNGFEDWSDFKSAVAVSNPGIADLNNISAGTKLYVPEKFADGSITYNYADGTAINSNAATGEYQMVVQNADGGQTVYSRTVDGDTGYVVHQVTTDKTGNITNEYNGHQDTLNSDTKIIDVDTYALTINGQTYTHQEFDAEGNITEVQTAVYDSTKGYTSVNVYHDGQLIWHTVIQGQATQAQLDNRDDLQRFLNLPQSQQQQLISWLNELFPETGISWTNESYETLITQLQTSFKLAEATISPLVLDLDGDGVETTISSKTGVHFDLDKSGFAEQAGWVGKDDGLLVRDLYGDGKITHGGELFGNHTVLQSGSQAANGFEALKDLDDNNDGKVDANDSAYASLRVWKDLNSDGVTEDGELITLEQAGVQSLNVRYTNQGTSATKDAQGNQHQQLGSYTKADGSTQQMDDVWFSVDTARTVNLNTVTVSDEIAALPELRGMGNVASLRQAMFQKPRDPIKRQHLVNKRHDRRIAA